MQKTRGKKELTAQESIPKPKMHTPVFFGLFFKTNFVVFCALLCFHSFIICVLGVHFLPPPNFF